MSAIACLPMYDWPESRAAVDALWSEIRSRAGADLPADLTRPADEAALMALWRDPALVFGQTCHGPLSLGLLPGLRLLAQPDYSDVEGGAGPFYRSVVVARSGRAMPAPAGAGAALPEGLLAGRVLARNAAHSLSGWLALRDDLALPGRGSAPRTIIDTGSHRASIRAVAVGAADLAAVDCRSWALARRHEPAAEGLVVVGWTAQRAGLPYVTAVATDAATAARLQDSLIAMGCHRPQETMQ